jgi:hypothetical protein
MQGQVTLEGLDVEDRKIILTNVSDESTSEEFAQEETVDFEGRGTVREVRVRTKDGVTTVKNLVVCESIKFSKVDEG